MAIVYVREQGTVIHKEYLQMVISKGKNKLRKIPLNCVEQLMVFGNIQITTQLMEYFLRENIEIHFFSYGGYFLGSCTGEHSRNIFLRCAQYEFFSDMEKKTSIAAMLLKQKILNQLAVLRHYRGPVSDEKEWKAYQVRLKELASSMEMLEPFRQPVGDRLVLRLFNKRILSSYDFEEDEGEGILLNQDGFQKFCYEYEKWMGSRKDGESYRNLMRNEAKSLRNLIQYGEVFEPWAWEI